MAGFTDFGGTATTGGVDLYTCPADTQAVIVAGILVALTGTDATATITIVRSGRTDYMTAIDQAVIANGTYTEISEKLALNAGDVIRIEASANSAVHFSGTVHERSTV